MYASGRVQKALIKKYEELTLTYRAYDLLGAIAANITSSLPTTTLARFTAIWFRTWRHSPRLVIFGLIDRVLLAALAIVENDKHIFRLDRRESFNLNFGHAE